MSRLQNDQSSDEEGDYASILTKMRQAFAADKKKPKEVCSPKSIIKSTAKFSSLLLAAALFLHHGPY